MSLEAFAVGNRPLHQRRGFRPLLLAAAFAMAGMSLPTPAQEATLTGDQAIPSLALGVWTSKDEESKDDFARRVGAAAHALTETTGYEVCGALLKEEQGSHYRLALATNQSQVGCMVLHVDQPGFAVTGETLHTHPNISSFTPNAVDARMFHVYEANHGRYPVDGTRFSDLDFESGPGYVVASGKGPFGKPRILYQAGVHTTRDLGKVERYDLADLAPDRDGALPTGTAVATTTSSQRDRPLAVSASRTRLP